MHICVHTYTHVFDGSVELSRCLWSSGWRREWLQFCWFSSEVQQFRPLALCALPLVELVLHKGVSVFSLVFRFAVSVVEKE